VCSILHEALWGANDWILVRQADANADNDTRAMTAHAMQKAAEEADNKVIGSRGRETILIAEDEPEVRSYLAGTLRELNYDVYEVSDAAAALTLFDTKPFHIDLLLTDIVMPRMNGRRLAEELLGRQASIRVLYMTGYSRHAQRLVPRPSRL
jgi:CheY-like chemotaxis protein